MPKRTSRPKRPAGLDTVKKGRRVVLESVGVIEPTTPDAPLVPSDPSLISAIMAEMGRKGGRIGGKRRLETMTDRQRSQVASKAAKARWSKKRRSAQ